MRHLFRYIIVVLSLSMAFLSLNSCGKDGVIDKDEMAQIYAEMLVTDQWINTTPGVRMVADTSLVYAPILERYGYTAVDYRRSVDYYLNDPDTYADIMKAAIKILDGRLAELHKRKHKMDQDKERAKYVKRIAKDLVINDSWFAIDRMEESGFSLNDSLSVEWDTLSLCFSLAKVPKKTIADSLSVTDTLMITDSLPRLDSLVVKEDLVGVQIDKKIKFIKGGSSFPITDTLFKKL